MSRVLVTGGTGFVGAHLVGALAKLGHQVVVLARRSSDLSELADVPMEIREGDILDRSSVLEAARGCDTIFHLAGLVSYKKSERPLMEKVNVEGTANVIQVCRDLKINNLVFMSSVVAVGAGRTPDQILNEASDYNLTKLNLGYFETKRAAEKLVLTLHQEGIVRCVIVNPSTIYGPADAKKSSRKTQVKVARGSFPFYTSGGVSVVDIEDVVQGLVLAWQKGRAGERYILSGENITIRELFRLIAEAAGVPPPKIHLPNFVLHALGALGDLQASLGKTSSLSRENAWTASMFHWFDHGKAQRELGFRSRPARESIEKSVTWMRKNGYLD